MVDTTTANLSLLIADLNDVYAFDTQVEANFTIIDTFMGAPKCTSTARPTTTWGGQIAYETDTKRLVENIGTGVSPVWVYQSSVILTFTSGTRPTLGLVAGLLIYESDKDAITRWTGTAWAYATTVVCTSTTRPATALASGTQIWETDTLAYAEYSGSAWRYTTQLTVTSTTRPAGTNVALVVGTDAYETDTGRQIYWTGAAWQPGSLIVCTSSTHPANPLVGSQVLETDTTAVGIWTGSAYVYGATRLGAVSLAASAPSMGISSIPAFNHLLLVYTGRQDSGSGGAYSFLQLNSDTASHYAYQNLVGSGASPTSSNGGALGTSIRMGVVPGSGDTASYFGAGQITLANIQSAVAFKPASCSYACAVSATSGYVGQTGGVWASTAAVTSLKLFPSSGNFVAGSSLTVYGLI